MASVSVCMGDTEWQAIGGVQMRQAGTPSTPRQTTPSGLPRRTLGLGVKPLPCSMPNPNPSRTGSRRDAEHAEVNSLSCLPRRTLCLGVKPLPRSKPNPNPSQTGSRKDAEHAEVISLFLSSSANSASWRETPSLFHAQPKPITNRFTQRRRARRGNQPFPVFLGELCVSA